MTQVMNNTSFAKSAQMAYEDFSVIIDQELEKRKHKWTLSALAWMDYSDVSQIIRLHIFKKWKLYDQSRPFLPWVNRVISSQMKNLIRNNYGNFSRPCLKCAAADSDESCVIYTKQCNVCPLFADWEKRKKSAYDTKLPLCLDNHAQEVYDIPEERVDIGKATTNMHNRMQQILKPLEWKVYKLLFIEHKDESEIAKIIGLSSAEKNDKNEYKQLKNIEKIILLKAKKIVEEIDFY